MRPGRCDISRVMVVFLLIGLTTSSCLPVPSLLTGATESLPPSYIFTMTSTSHPTATPSPGIGSIRTRPADGMLMLYVPAGQFTMGSQLQEILEICTQLAVECEPDWFSDEQPAHVVYLDAYWIDRTEVSNGMYLACVAAGSCAAPSANSFTRSSYFGNPVYAAYPVIFVSWQDAQTYCTWAGARLPTEAEWEKAARGVDGRKFPWGDALPDCTLAGYDSCTGDTIPVDSTLAGASPYGALDLAGNVWEWVSDWYDPSYYAVSPGINPHGPSSGERRVLRGGYWGIDPLVLRTSARAAGDPDEAGRGIGFRCARDAYP